MREAKLEARQSQPESAAPRSVDKKQCLAPPSVHTCNKVVPFEIGEGLSLKVSHGVAARHSLAIPRMFDRRFSVVEK